MSVTNSFCPNCGTPIHTTADYCANCGTKLNASGHAISQTPPSVFQPVPLPQRPVSTGAYKAIIAVLLVIIILLGVGLYSSTGGHLLQFGPSRYQLTNPPNTQSIQPPNTVTASPPYTVIWNACGGGPSQGCSMSANGWREGGVPDTYDYFVTFSSNVNVTVYFFTLGQFVQYAVCNGDLSCVSGAVYSIPASTSQQDAPFKLAEGCADYVAIYVASGTGTMYPSVSVKQNSAGAATGYCAQAGSG